MDSFIYDILDSGSIPTRMVGVIFVYREYY